MNYPRLFERVYLQPVAITPQRFSSIHAFLLPRLKGAAPVEIIAADSARPNFSRLSGRRTQYAGPTRKADGSIDERFYSEAAPGVAVVPVYGALAKNLSAWEESCGGGTDINPLQHAFRQALAAADIHTIILDIDSPGGEVTNIPEFGRMIAAGAAQKRVVAFTDASMCSAAYWLGCSASAVFATASATVGSIGVYMAWLDETVRMELEGVALQFFAAGKHKGIGLPGRALSDEDKALLQSSVDQIYADFTGHVVARRGSVDSGTMQGQTFKGSDAKTRNLVDGVVESFDELVAALALHPS